MYNGQNYIDLDSSSSYLNESSYNFTNIKKQAYSILYIFMLVFISISVLLYVSQIITINKQSSRLLNLEERLESIKAKNERLEVDLAAKTSLAEVEKIIKAEIEKNSDKYFQNEYGFQNLKEDQCYYLKSGELVVYFQPYAIAPYSTGMPEFKIEY